jgi:hypothetical protein
VIFAISIPEDYRARSGASYPICIASEGALIQALFTPVEEMVIGRDIEAFLRIVARRANGDIAPLASLSFTRGKYAANNVVPFRLNSSTVTEPGDVLYLYKEIASGLLAFPESLVQIKCQ